MEKRDNIHRLLLFFGLAKEVFVTLYWKGCAQDWHDTFITMTYVLWFMHVYDNGH